MIRNKEGIPPAEQILRFSGKSLQDNLTLSGYKIHNGCYLYMVTDFAIVSHANPQIDQLAQDVEYLQRVQLDLFDHFENDDM